LIQPVKIDLDLAQDGLVLRESALIAKRGLAPRGEQGLWLAELAAGVADEVVVAFERRNDRVEHRVESPPEPGVFIVGLLTWRDYRRGGVREALIANDIAVVAP
jgi:hypothetical protein